MKNCQGYDEDKKCMICKEGYLLEDEECVLKDIFKCLIYENSTNCLLCEDGYAVDDVDGVRICVEIPEVINCVEYDINLSPFRCTKCSGLFYLDPIANECLPVDEENLI